MSQRLENVIKQMLDFGYTKEQVTEITNLSVNDVVEVLLQDLVGVLDEAKLGDYKNRLEAAQTDEDKTAILDEMCAAAYADQAEEKKLDAIATVLEALMKDAEKMRELYGKYQQGDPETVKKLDDAMKTPEAQQLQQDMQAATDEMKTQE